jgi:hypothetical protein
MRSNIVRVLVAVAVTSGVTLACNGVAAAAEKDGGSGPSQGGPTSLAGGVLSDNPLCKAVGAAPGCK